METFTVDNQKLMQEHKWVYEDIPSLSSLQLFSFPRDWKKNKGLYKSVSCVLLLWPLTCLAWNGPREQSRLGRAHGLKGLLVHLLERWCEATCRVFLTIVFKICRLLTLARPLLIFLFLVSWRSNTAIFRAKRGSARQAHKSERGAGQMKWEYFLFPNLDS